MGVAVGVGVSVGEGVMVGVGVCVASRGMSTGRSTPEQPVRVARRMSHKISYFFMMNSSCAAGSRSAKHSFLS